MPHSFQPTLRNCLIKDFPKLENLIRCILHQCGRKYANTRPGESVASQRQSARFGQAKIASRVVRRVFHHHETPKGVLIQRNPQPIEIEIRKRIRTDNDKILLTQETKCLLDAPTGFQGTKYSAMIQVAVPGSPLPNATWDLDASFVTAGRAAENFSGRIVAGEPGTPVVFEVQVEFEPGAYGLTLAARETTAGQSGSKKVEGRWPDPNTERATVSPLVLLQPAQGAFVRGENARGQGALALGDDDPVQAQLPTAVISVVCRGSGVAEPVSVQRNLEGASSIKFKTITLSPDQDQCAQVRDMIPPGTLGQGHFKYELKLVTSTGTLADGERKFTAIPGRPGS